MNNNITILPGGCTRMNHSVRRFCLPIKVDCDKTVIDGLFTECGDLWNCGSCGSDKQYLIPVPTDGMIMLQTNFNRFDNSIGWGNAIGASSWITIDLLDKEGNVVENAFQHLTKHITGRSSRHSYQTIEIDVSSIPIDCFSFKIYSATEEICTQLFTKEICNNLIEIEGEYTNFDCWNNYYGYPVGIYAGTSFQYSNKVFLKAEQKSYSLTPKDSVIDEVIRLLPAELVAPFMARYLMYKILNASNVLIEGEKWYNTGQVLTARPKSNMFWPLLEFSKISCDSGFGSCEMN